MKRKINVSYTNKIKKKYSLFEKIMNLKHIFITSSYGIYFIGTFPALFPCHTFWDNKFKSNKSLYKHHAIILCMFASSITWPISLPIIKLVEIVEYHQ